MRKHESLFLAFWIVHIREFRVKKHLSQERLAEKLCLNTRNFQKLERGVHKPSAITIILFLYLLSDQEIISFIRSFGQMAEKADSQEVA
ncbi:MAG TPA: helix-turn-helix domain-containing protein [Candidatus Acutalibacter ornithocaccae]|uniref:Helix-turn-helix domain-containing protein n=1 Tax=Candidatus Acutalibacter ornithocaccae TaxID=2838416 RepID=A0A9D2LXD8_9FIRM|nr:helix-turn-helix domain-containing protein [Candidatus Acutalibacter ornithocaccae]